MQLPDKVIFLDLDGVLNLIYLDTGRDEYGELFSDEQVDNLEYIIKETDAKIIISSSWKDSGSWVMKEMWKDRNLPGEVIGITPNVVDIDDIKHYDLADRGAEIAQWIKNKNFKGKYVIIDDIPDFSIEQTKYFVQTNQRTGLTREDSIKAINILNNE